MVIEEGPNRKDVKLPTQGWEPELQVWALREERKGVILEFLCLLPAVFITLVGLSISFLHDGIARLEAQVAFCVCVLFLWLVLRVALKCSRINKEISRKLRQVMEQNREIVKTIGKPS